MVDIEVVELLDSSEDEAPPMRAEPDIQEVTVDRQIRAPEAAAGDDADDVIITGAEPAKHVGTPSSPRIGTHHTPASVSCDASHPTGLVDAAYHSVRRAVLRSPRF